MFTTNFVFLESGTQGILMPVGLAPALNHDPELPSRHPKSLLQPGTQVLGTLSGLNSRAKCASTYS